MDFFKLEVVCEFADGRLVLARFCFRDVHHGISPQLTLAVNSRKVILLCQKKNTVNERKG